MPIQQDWVNTDRRLAKDSMAQATITGSDTALTKGPKDKKASHTLKGPG